MNHTEQEYNELREALQEANNQRLQQGKIWLEENKQLEKINAELFHELTPLKQKLEKIKEVFYNTGFPMASAKCKKIKEILGDKK